MFATGSRTSPAAKANPTWTASTDRAAASTTPRGTNTPSIILSPDPGVRAPRHGWAPRAHEDRHDAHAGGDTRALTLRRVRLPPRHECAPVLAAVKVVRPVGCSTLTSTPGRQQDDHEGAALSAPTNHAAAGPTTGKDLTA